VPDFVWEPQDYRQSGWFDCGGLLVVWLMDGLLVGVGCVGWFAFDGWFHVLALFCLSPRIVSVPIYLSLTVLVSRFFGDPLLFDQHEPHFFCVVARVVVGEFCSTGFYAFSVNSL
jgi:hypothetical protein